MRIEIGLFTYDKSPILKKQKKIKRFSILEGTNVKRFRVQKILRISRVTPQFAKLNGREKKKNCDLFAKINSHESQFQDFLGHFLPIRT